MMKVEVLPDQVSVATRAARLIAAAARAAVAERGRFALAVSRWTHRDRGSVHTRRPRRADRALLLADAAAAAALPSPR